MPVRAPFGVARGSYESPETVPWIREQDWSKSAGFAKVWWVIWIEMWSSFSSFGENWMMSKRRLRGNRSEWLKKVRKWMHGCVKSQEIMKIGEETFDWRRVWVIWLRRICIESAGCCWFGMQIWVVLWNVWCWDPIWWESWSFIEVRLIWRTSILAQRKRIDSFGSMRFDAHWGNQSWSWWLQAIVEHCIKMKEENSIRSCKVWWEYPWMSLRWGWLDGWNPSFDYFLAKKGSETTETNVCDARRRRANLLQNSRTTANLHAPKRGEEKERKREKGREREGKRKRGKGGEREKRKRKEKGERETWNRPRTKNKPLFFFFFFFK